MPTAVTLDLEDIEDLVSRDEASLQRKNLKVLPHPQLMQMVLNRLTKIAGLSNFCIVDSWIV